MRAVGRLLAAIAAIAFAVALFDVLAGGFFYQLGPIRLSSREAYKPFTLGAICASLALSLHDRKSAGTVSWDRLPRWAPWVVAAASVLTVLAGIRWGLFVAGGADAYGYVSQAMLWADGRLVVPEPLALLDPSMARSAAPLGYQLAATPGTIVPSYPSGLPLMMALAMTLGGPSAAYLVVPLLGALAVWLTYKTGERTAGPRTGLLAALLLACSPLFLLLLFSAMSDLPATTWWLLALALVFSETAAAPLLAGLAAGAAILTRPNLLPLAVLVLLPIVRVQPRARRALLFGVGVVPGCLAVAWINNTLYGSPLTSGYGPLGAVFNWGWWDDNLRRYPVWLFQMYTAGIYIALASPFVSGRRGGPGVDRGVHRPGATGLLLAFCGAVLASYLFYLPFDEWPFLRFMLPAIPLLLVLASAVAIRLIGAAPKPFRGAAVLALCALTACWYLRTAERLGVFATQASERRYAVVGEHVARVLPPSAVVLTVIQSGSIRLYGDRGTLRWDQLPADALDHALDVLRAHGHAPYILLEEWEEPEFRAKFAAASVFGRLDWPPAFEYRGGVPVRIYAPDDRAREPADRLHTREILQPER